jgi:hypothetical protein
VSARHQVMRRAVFRNRILAGLAAVFIAPCLLIGVTVLPGPGQHGAFVGGAVISGIAWLMWVLGWWTKVVVSPDGVVIDNVIVRHVVPADQFDRFVLDFGIWVRAKDGRRFWLFGYGGSLLGQITGYRSQRRVLARMETAAAVIADNADPRARYRTLVKIPWWPLPALLILLEGAVVIGHHAL